MTPRRLLAPARCGASLRRALMLEVAKPPAGVALLAAAAVGVSPRVDGLCAPPAVVGVLAPLGSRAPAHDEPLVVVVSTHDPGVDVGRDQQGQQITLRSANDLSLRASSSFPLAEVLHLLRN